MRVLARTVDVCIPQRDVIDPVLHLIEEQIRLGGELGDSVWAYGPPRMLLVAGKLLLLAVDCSTRRGKHDAFESVAPRRLHQVEEPDEINPRIERRVRDRTSYVHLGRQMINHLGFLALKDRGSR